MKRNVDLIIAGYTGLWKTGELLKQHRGELEQRFPETFLQTAEDMAERFTNPEIQTQTENLLRGMGRGAVCFSAEHGLERALWQAGAAADCGLEAEISRIPIRQETIELTEYYDLNPYRLDSPGVWVILSENGAAVCDRIRTVLPASLAGSLTEGHDRVFLYDHGRERRFLEPRSTA